MSDASPELVPALPFKLILFVLVDGCLGLSYGG
jgi:flagellar biosynthesis protein FliP